MSGILEITVGRLLTRTVTASERPKIISITWQVFPVSLHSEFSRGRFLTRCSGGLDGITVGSFAMSQRNT